MSEIQLLYVENVISRKTDVVRQHLSFFMVVESHGYDKKIDVLWAGEDNVWHTLPAMYHSHLGDNKEYWRAHTAIPLAADKSLPGNITFALRYQTSDAEYWDNDQGQNHTSQADSGIRLAHHVPLQNIGFADMLEAGQRVVPVTVAVDKTLDAEKVTLHWTTDNWKNSYKTPCHFKRNYWDHEYLSNARNPNQYGAQIWQGSLKINNAYRVQYCISCESREQVVWDNNFGRNYALHHEQLKVLILNLHCYQEEDQDQKFSQIAKAINELDVDIVCLQEVAELWNDGQGDWNTNSAKIINERLATPYHLVTDWAHLGFERYREGVAILSRFPVVRHKSKYVSSSHDPYSIHSRKVVMAQIRAPYAGLINVFSSHLSWWDDGFAEQFERLRKWAADEQTWQVKGTLLCGDFNIKAGSQGYAQVVDSNEYDDQYLAATAPDVFARIYRDKGKHWSRLLDDDQRIDYVFLSKSSGLSVTSGRVLFTEQDYGRVSDHCGYLMTFEPK